MKTWRWWTVALLIFSSASVCSGTLPDERVVSFQTSFQNAPEANVPKTLEALIFVTEGALGGKIAESKVTLPGQIDLVIPKGEAKDPFLRVQAPGWWAPPTRIDTTPGVQQPDLHFVPAGVLVGKLHFPRSVEPSGIIQFTLSAPEETAAESDLRISCAVGSEDGHFSCTVPAGVHDLRAAVPGYISHYFWSQAV